MRVGTTLLLALMMVMPATAQIASWDDDASDQVVHYRATGDETVAYDIPNNAGWYPHFDILRTGIYEEKADNFAFELVLADTQATGTEPDYVDEIHYTIHFTFHDEAMRLSVYWYPEWLDEPFAYVERWDGEYWQYLTWSWAQTHPTEDEGWLFQVDKLQLRDQQLVPARAGDEIKDIYASAQRSEWAWTSPVPSPIGFHFFGGTCVSTGENIIEGDCGVQPRDDAGTIDSPLGSYELTESPDGLGHVLLEVDRPFRASNGLATTYVYSLRLMNLADEPDTISLAATNIPSNWDIYLPPRVEMEPQEVKEIRMAVGVPFGHKHGEYSSVDIRAKSERIPETTAETSLWVFWPEIAQPSGHHPRMYMHSDGWRDWMNTVQADPAEDGSDHAPGDGYSSIADTGPDGSTQYSIQHSYWSFYLRPSLFTGLDFEVDKPILGNLEIALPRTSDAEVALELVLYRENQDPLIIGEQTQTISFTANQASTIPVDMAVAAAADRIQFQPNSGMYLNIDITAPTTDPADAATNEAGPIVGLGDVDPDGELYTLNSYLDLPLLDYHDDVEPGLLDALTRLQLEAPEEVVRPVNPGKTAAYYFEIINKGDIDDTVEWTIEGPESDWAQVVPGYSDVDANGRATVAIRVDVPEDARQDAVADLLLVGQSTENPDAQVFGQFLAYVETSADIPDESDLFADLQSTAEENESKGAPFPAIVGVAAVGLAALARRRTN